MSADDYLADLSNEDLELSKQGLKLLKGKSVTRYRWDSKRRELYIEFDDNTRLFIDKIMDKYDISIT